MVEGVKKANAFCLLAITEPGRDPANAPKKSPKIVGIRIIAIPPQMETLAVSWRRGGGQVR
jgi:hypothetical protein